MREWLCLAAFGCTVAGVLTGKTALTASLAASGASIGAIVAGALCGRRYTRAIALLASAFVLGAVLSGLACAKARKGILPALSERRAAVIVEGTAVSGVSRGRRGAWFWMSVSRVRRGPSAWNTSERLLVRLEKESEAIRRASHGAQLEVRGTLEPAGEFAGRLVERGAACSLRAAKVRTCKGVQARGYLTSLFSRARSFLSGMYGRLYERRVAGFIEGVTLGKLDRLPEETVAELRNAGLSHLVAVSGLHVTSAAAIAIAALAAAGAGAGTRRAGACLVAMIVAGLAMFRPSASRAFLMATAAFGAAAAGRRSSPVTGLSIAGILLVCFSPMTVYDRGFQFSFAAAIGIIIGSRAAVRADRRGKVRSLLSASACAQLAVMPLVLAGGGGVPVTALAANIVAVPLAGPILLTGWASAVAGWPAIGLGRAVAVIPDALSRVVLRVAAALSTVPMSGVARGALPAASLALYSIALFFIAVRARRGGSLAMPLSAVALSALVLLSPLVPLTRAGQGGDTLTVLDVGQGDSMLARDRTGACVLVDGGPDGELLLRKLAERGVARLDLVVLSHAHEDHAAGLVDVVRSLPVGTLVHSGIMGGEGASSRELIASARSRGVRVAEVAEGSVVKVSESTSLEVVHPGQGCADVGGGQGCENLNDCSLVALLRMQGGTALLAGDVESGGQVRMTGFHPDLDCDVLKVPHQGAADASTREMVEACRPEIAVISVGAKNSYGHPSARCLEILGEYGARLFRTDRDGDVELRMAGDRITVKTGRGGR